MLGKIVKLPFVVGEKIVGIDAPTIAGCFSIKGN